MRELLLYSTLLALPLLTCCSDNQDDLEVKLPSDLTYTIDISTEKEGLVSIEANATNASYYSIIFKDYGGEETISNLTGSASYEYASSGLFTIKIRAHANQTQYIEAREDIEIVFASDTINTIPETGYTTPLTYPNYTLVWSDEFSGNNLSSNWNFEIGTGNNGWGNNELQYYTERNVAVADGVLTITAKKEFAFNREYTSSRITTQGKQSFKYGRIDIRAALPQGQGLWPALWMLGDNFSSVGWPACGEIDIMELVGGAGNRDKTVHGTLHWDNNGSKADHGGSYTISNGDLSKEWHVYSIVWDANTITWFIDNIQYHSMGITSGAMSEFHEPFFFIFNVAVGGNWPGSPNPGTQFPQKMHVDYVRVFQPK